MKVLTIFSFFYLLAGALLANKYDCIIAAKKYEEIYGIPENLLLSVSLTESGRKIKNGEFISWPWTINRKGKGKFFDNKVTAINYVKEYTKNGKKNIDLGCMQVNFMYHPNAFKNFYEAFDPDKNVEWAANMLKSLYAKFGTWETAVGYYHSYRKSKRKKYSQKVFNTLAYIKNHNNFNFIQVTENEESGEEDKTNQIKKNSLSLVKEKINSYEKQKKPNTNSDYILARMEKVNFFRNYFHKKNN
tara:strand:- start:877 stop:1611 length:735 start_codon:yes stop_codon:yes gene_type:complete